MKITFAVSEFPLRSETFVLSQVLFCARQGHRVQVICNAVGSMNLLDEDQRLILGRVDICLWPKLPAIAARLPWRIRQYIELKLSARALKRLDTDLLLAHFGYTGKRLAELRRIAGVKVPLVTVYHGRDVSHEWQRNRMAEYKSLLDDGELHLAVNQKFSDLLIEAGAERSSVKVHHLGVPVEKYNFRPMRRSSPLKFLSVCRLVEKKGLKIALEALALLKDRHPQWEWQYDIGGEGPELDYLLKQVKTLGLEDHVSFLGPLNHDAALTRICVADAFLLPSITASDGDQEGIPVVLMEAMALGTLVISTLHSGIPELVDHGVSGLLAKEGDVEDLYNALKIVILEQLDIDLLITSARSKIEMHFNENQQNAQMIDFFKTIIL